MRLDTWERPERPGEGSVRGVDLLEDERVEHLFVPDKGLVDAMPAKGPLLVLTTRRVISFGRTDGRQETTLIPLTDLKGASVRRDSRSLKSLFQGVALALLGVVAYLFVGLFVVDTGSIAIPAAVGGVIIFAGALLITRFFFWEQEGAISFIAFREEGWDLSFSYRGNKAGDDLSQVVNRFFRLKDEVDHDLQSIEEEPYLPFF